MPLSISQALKDATEQLQPVSDTARLDAEILLGHVLNKDRIFFLTWPEQALSLSEQQQFQELVLRRAKGEPIAYIINQQEFWSLKLRVTPDTLIPRPETELLVEEALQLIKENTSETIVDLGTGSGAIAIAIASERPQCHVVGVDRSAAAVEIATDNARQLGLTNVAIQQGNWLEDFADESLDMVVTNPPYVAQDDPHLQQGDVRFEPGTALSAGPEGMDEYHKIVPEAKRCLKKQGWLLMEHGYDQQDKLIALLQAHGFQAVRGLQDYAGQPRVVMGQA